jgi:endonuclease G
MNVHWIISGASPKGFKWHGGPTVNRDCGLLVEAIIGEPNFTHIWWMEKAIQASRHVARVKLPNGSATGFLIAPDILMTNNHVFQNARDAANAVIQFNYRLLPDGNAAPVDEWLCDPDSLFKTSVELDFSITRLKTKEGNKAGDVWGYFDVRHGQTAHENQRVNIIQHPAGRYLEIAFRDNQVKAINEDTIQYLTDTDYGSSGSPVCDDFFNLIALHNQRVRDPNDPYRWYRNQGFRIDAILPEIETWIP